MLHGMSRRKQAPAQVSSKKRKAIGEDEENDRPVVISEHEQQTFSVEIGNRIGKWTEEYSDSASLLQNAHVS